MSEEKNTLKIIDETIKAVQGIPKILETAKNELIEIRNEKDKLEKEKIQLEKEKKKLEESTKQLEREKQERDEKIGAMTEKQMKLLEEYEKVKEELQKFAKIATEMEEAELDFERIKALLSIYTVLLEEIWQGQPHFRILLTLHGDKEEMSREELKLSTGVSGAMVLRAIQELANVEIVEYNPDTGMSKLKKRLFPKKVIKEV